MRYKIKINDDERQLIACFAILTFFQNLRIKIVEGYILTAFYP